LCAIAGYYRIGADPVRLQRELALGARQADDELDLIRAATLIGMRARLATRASAERMLRMPTPAIVRLTSGALCIFAGRVASGLCSLVGPVTHAVAEIPPEALVRETHGQALLLARRLGGAGADPRSFSMRWFLPTIWRYRKPLESPPARTQPPGAGAASPPARAASPPAGERRGRRVLPFAPAFGRDLSDREFLAPALEILETPPSPVHLAFLWIICALVVAGLAWA
jgi:hypothetical protein